MTGYVPVFSRDRLDHKGPDGKGETNVNNTISRKAIEAAAAEDIEMREDYIGRGMFGEECVGIVGSLNALLTFLSILVSYCDSEGEAADLLSDLARGAQEDSMGRQSIYYFPGWTVGE